ncbi:MAG: alanine--tRNA ligase [Chloroflexi bacterium]|nr:alanine--tRNA ligase [Chloroflexota bacterium]
MTGDELRKAFLSFFEGKGHTVLPSSSLIPQGDPTLLLTTAGMVQIKPYFLGLATPPNTRLTSCQKCFRTTDIDSVGDTRHLTFFEMLGNFSVGDYFRKEAIEWAWEFVIQWLKFPPERLWITVFLDDDEAFKYWRQIGVPAERIVRLGEKQNFWGPAGDSGPCGPCSEIHYDFGVELGCGESGCGPACDCGRFSEIWNLVFTQYDQNKEGRRTPLPKPNIDTGMGLERVAAVMQGKRSVYETDLFAPIVARVAQISGKRFGEGDKTDKSIKIVSEHVRGIPFLIADGVVPSNEGRGYVLRRLLRRASLFGRNLGLEDPFLVTLADFVIEKMGRVYPELKLNQNLVRNVIDMEEKRFGQVIDAGIGHLDAVLLEMIENVRRQALSPNFAETFAQVQKMVQHLQQDAIPMQAIKQYQEAASLLQKAVQHLQQDAIPMQAIKQYQEAASQWQKTLQVFKLDASLIRVLQQFKPFVIPGGEAFKLYDTYGFPKELTEEIAAEGGFHVDSQEFEREMEKQQERARASHKFSLGDRTDLKSYEQLGITRTEFVGYDRQNHKSVVMGLIAGGRPVESASEHDEVEVILKETPFYGEMGGQVGDTGVIRGGHGAVSVTQTTRPLPDLTVHHSEVIRGRIAVGDSIEAEVDLPRRLDIARNHTATHLLQSALRAVLGQHVRQSGSLVAPDRFRFDFTHLEPVGKERLLEIQHLVNEKIRQNLSVVAQNTSYGEAVSEGATALFGEKYGEVVRMISIGDPPFSVELCGGTHVHSTGEIGILHIIAEESVGSGVRRIEAVTGSGAERLLEQRASMLEFLALELQTVPDGVEAKVSSILVELDVERKRALAMEREIARQMAGPLLSQVKVINGVNVLSAKVSATSPEAVREVGDRLKEELKSGVIVLGAVYNERPSLLSMVTPDLIAKGFHAGDLVKQVAKVVGGGGGGKAELGQGSGKDATKLEEALKQAASLVELHYDKDSGVWRKDVG